MRQIFSVILAAALVFGGALFVAGYWDRDGGKVWYCPSIEDILTGQVSKEFRLREGDQDAGIEDFKWVSALILGQPSFKTHRPPHGPGLYCSYYGRYREKGFADFLTVSLSPGLSAYIDPLGDWAEDETDMHGYSFVCKSQIEGCGFYVNGEK